MPFRNLLTLIVTVTSQVVVLVFVQIILIRQLGANKASDVYYASLTVPLFISTVINSGLQAVWLPRLSALFSTNNDWNKKKSEALGQSLIAGILGYIISILIIILAGRLIFFGFDEQQYQELNFYSLIISAIIIFNSISNVCFSILRSQHRFLIVEICELAVNLLYLASIFHLSNYKNIIFLVWLYLLKSILFATFNLVIAGFPKFAIKDAIKNVDEWRLMAPIIFSSPIYKLSAVIDKFWISQSGPGVMSLINFATSGINAIILILDKILVRPILPKISIFANLNKKIEIKNLYRRKIAVIGAIFIVSLFVLIVFKNLFLFLINFLLKIDHYQSEEFFSYLVLISPLILFTSTGNLIASIFYSYKKTKMVTYISLLGFIFGIIYKTFLFKIFGLYGLLIGMSLTFITTILIFILVLNVKLRFKINFV